MIEIIPAIIPQDLDEIRKKFGRVLGLAKKVQVDILDGQYAPVKSWPFIEKNSDDLFKMAKGELKFPFIDEFLVQIDLMVLHPVEYLNDFISLGAKSFVIHIDSTNHIRECLSMIKGLDCKVGLGIKPSVDTALLEPFMEQIDFVQFMGNDKIGYNGVELDNSVINKIKYFHHKNREMPIQIDIGVSEETIPILKSIGVTSFISCSAIFNSLDPEESFKKMQNL
ncbi:MAG: hypothetical protein GX627_02385 [Parcubacteria group bacterium]|jgi:ribulose-phosphate 3-epimerase|nr:hypothetical protein [Parcubacteria group bacterium]